MEIKPIFSALMRSKTGPILVAVQVALSLAILANALHIVSVRQAVAARPTGIANEEQVFNISVKPLRPGGHEEQLAAQQAQAAALRAIPGVVSVADTNQIALSNSGNYNSVAASRDQLRTSASPTLYLTPDSLVKTWGLKLVDGRDFNAQDVVEVDRNTSKAFASVALVSKALGQKVWPDAASYVGKKMFYGTGPEAREVTVVGVVETLQTPGAAMGAEGEWSTMVAMRLTGTWRNLYTVRAEAGQRDRAIKDAEQALRKLHRGQVVLHTTTQSEERAKRYKADNALCWMLITVSVLLMVVTASGIVGMASLWVTQRRKQIGIRRALGARKIDILRYFVTENLMITTTGIAGGLLGALALNQLLVSKLELARLPAEYMVVGALASWALGIAAVYGPAWRAASISPAMATRSA
ncbi:MULTISPECIES: ABC transporter permease [unclassified Duganella]|uniref:ABC transporter permease n=1 Tax=unclassified Duganella TaxID=2636909 RepID=UPI0006FE0E83|nr:MULTISPECIES: FtsX-like permease family protein [unclassified Duganella]KQV55425.1 ABC transporter permease [Duganella sp. Root336D2]KRB95879.1 ABC transporter permease [Duganella sp. Root198D2]